jgi:tetratricopeptide (TPR) repeat protein
MKKNLLALLLAGIGAAFVAYWHQPPPPRLDQDPSASVAVTESRPAPALALNPPERPVESARPAAAAAPQSPLVRSNAPAALPAAPAAASLAQTIDSALDATTSYAQRQAIWNQLRDGGQLDPAMAELEKRAAQEPANALIPASLGQLCLQKAAQLTNSIADQGLFGLTADKMFAQSLTLDPANWEARFWKATAMAHWPAMMNKSQEVMGHYVALIEQQETQPPQPEFAQTYLWLGKEYAKGGYAEDAKDVWQRGLRFFPNDTALKEKLTISEN